MSLARFKLQARSALLRAASKRDDLVAKPPQEVDWNEHARLVKASLFLSAFTSLEEFVQGRLREVIARLQGQSPAATGIPEPLKNALVVGAFEALGARIREPKRFAIVDARAYILSQSLKIASSLHAALDPSDLTLSMTSSNASWKFIEDALLAFGTESPLSVVNGVARRIEGGVFVAKDHFESALEVRHKIAHSSDADIAIGDVRGFVEKLTLMCCAIDVVLSTALKRVVDAAHAGHPPVTKNADVKLRFVEKSGRRWKCRAETAGRAASTHETKAGAISSSELLARARAECVVVRVDGGSATEAWSTPFL